MIFTDNKNKVIYKTEILDFYFVDEYALEEDIFNVTWNDKKILSYHINRI